MILVLTSMPRLIVRKLIKEAGRTARKRTVGYKMRNDSGSNQVTVVELEKAEEFDIYF